MAYSLHLIDYSIELSSHPNTSDQSRYNNLYLIYFVSEKPNLIWPNIFGLGFWNQNILKLWLWLLNLIQFQIWCTIFWFAPTKPSPIDYEFMMNTMIVDHPVIYARQHSPWIGRLTKSFFWTHDDPVSWAAEQTVLQENGSPHGSGFFVVRDSVQGQDVAIAGRHGVHFHRVAVLDDQLRLKTRITSFKYVGFQLLNYIFRLWAEIKGWKWQIT